MEKILGLFKRRKEDLCIGVLIIVLLGGVTFSVTYLIGGEQSNSIVDVGDSGSEEENNNAEKEVTAKLDELKNIDTSKLSNEDKQSIESKIAEIEKLIENKEYAKATTDIENLKKDVDSKIEEVAKNEEATKEEENTETEEVATNATENSTSSTVDNSSSSNSTNNSTNNSTTQNSSSSSNTTGNTNSSNQQVVEQPSTLPVQQEQVQQPVVQEPVQQPTTPPVVEEQKPVYPSVVEVQQRLIAYGQSLGLTYDPSINSATEGTVMQGTDQMWSSGLGGTTDQKRLFNGLITAGCYPWVVR